MKKSTIIKIAIPVIIIVSMFWQNMILKNDNSKKGQEVSTKEQELLIKDKELLIREQKLAMVNQQGKNIVSFQFFNELPAELQQATNSIVAISADTTMAKK